MIGKSALLGIAVMCISGCDPAPTHNKADASPAADASHGASPQALTPWIKPESIVRFPKGEMACLQLDDLHDMMGLAVSGHKTKMMAYFSPTSDGGLRCIMLTSTHRYKVIDVQANDPDMPDALILEVVGAGIGQADKGAFVVTLDKSFVNVVHAGV